MKRLIAATVLALDGTPSTHPRLKFIAWAGGGVALTALFLIRAASGAEFAFASLALLPVIGCAWATGRTAGAVMALLATATWIAGDLASDRSFSRSWIPWLNGVINGSVYLLVAVLAAELRELLQREHGRASRDALTGLLNRRRFLEMGRVEVARSIRSGHALTLVFLDVDHFKQLNDRHGHDAGDGALRALAQALQTSAREQDLVARLGGDEFVVMLVGIDGATCGHAAHRLATTANAALQRSSRLTASVGAAHFAHPVVPVEEMLRAADSLMYRAKQAGRGSLIVQAFPVHGRAAA